jgi:thiol:disulfide interchange protein DsbD
MAHADDDFLDPAKAFQFSAKMRDARTAEVTYLIADGYHMYRERFKIEAKDADLGEPVYPKGQVEYDDTFQKNVETYRHSVTIVVPLKSAAQNFTLNVTGQGCADKGLCYPPAEVSATLSTAGLPEPSVNTAAPAASSASTPADDGSGVESALRGGHLLAIIPLFFVIGLGLSFTPCVLPLVPILSSIIVGEGTDVGRKRGFMLSVAYSLGMALVYKSGTEVANGRVIGYQDAVKFNQSLGVL